MRIINCHRSPVRASGITWVRLATSGLIMFTAIIASAEDSQFAFDPNGNLLAQSAAILSPPQIIAQPQPQVAAPGALASFFVIVANTGDLTYQWRFNDTNIVGATNDALLLQNVGAANEGQYSVVLVNSSGSITSAPAALWLDTDRDGLPDAWELMHFGNLNQRPTGDFDNDGVSNLDEHLDGTNPADNTSVRFRLTVLSTDGLVTVAPSRLSYTNGEVVTLTATPFAPNVFRGWTGDTNTMTNPLTLTMTTNLTVIARLGSLELVWANVAGGDWNSASNWNPRVVPGPTDQVFIDRNATVTINSPGECGSLTLGSSTSLPTLTGIGTLTVHKDSFWASGIMSGGGLTVIPPGVVLTVANGSTVTLGRTLDNGGTVVWTGAAINLNGGIVTNRTGALFETRGASSLTFGGGVSRFHNAGTFRKVVHTGTTTVGNISFNNSGTVELQTGTLALGGGGTHSGNFDVPAGTALTFSGGTHTATESSTLTGAGSLTVSAGTSTLAGLINLSGTHVFSGGTAHLTGNYICTNNTLTIAGGTANFNGTGLVQPGSLNLSSGTLSGSNSVTVLQQMNWTGGTMSGSGPTVIPPGVTLTVANSSPVTLSRTLDNGGTVLMTGAAINLNGGTIANRAGALFETRGAGALNGGGVSRFDNDGTFRKAVHTGTTTVGNISFNNSGTVELQTGTLALGGGGTHSGSFVVPAGTGLTFSGGTHTAHESSTISGAGNLTVSAGTTTLAGLVNLSGNHLFSAGTAHLTGSYNCNNNTLTIAGGTANFNGTGTVQPGVLNLSSGTLSGNQAVIVLTQMNWTGGTMSGSGQTVIPPGGTLTVANGGPVTLSRTLDNGGTVLMTGAAINLNGGTMTNQLGALFETRSAGALTFGGGVNRFDNSGTFRKAVHTGITTVGNISFNNSGTVELQTGTLALGGGGTHSGTFAVPTDTALTLSGGTHTASEGSTITGAGHLTVSGGTATLAGLVTLSGNHLFSAGIAHLTGTYICTNNTLTIAGGTANFNGTGLVQPAVLNLSSGTLSGSNLVTVGTTMNWTGGTMNGSGQTVIPPGATLTVANPGSVNLRRTLDNSGTVLWTGAAIALNGGIITNRAGALFETRNASALNYGGGVNRFDNAGTFRKAGHTGTTTIANGIPFNNYQAVEIGTGILAVNGGYHSTTNSSLECAIGGTTVGSGYSRLQLSGAVTLNGALKVALTNGFVPAVSNSFTVLTAGTRNGTFANFYYPSNEVTMLMSNAANSVIVRVTDIFSAIPPTVLLPPELIGADIKLTWTAVSNTTYRVEFNPNLTPSNWNALSGDVIASSNTASKLDLLTPTNRFYRVRVVP